MSNPHRRYNPLTSTWVLCSPHRASRPWQGAVEPPNLESLPSYDPKCYLCPGNPRVGGEQNDQYEGTFVFENDFAAVRSPEKDAEQEPAQAAQLTDASSTLLRSEPAHGKCFVIAYSPSHALTMSQLSQPQISQVISTWKSLYNSASQLDYVNYIQIFENKGQAMGCSNPHPHGQSWTLSYIPTLPNKMLENMHAYASRPQTNTDAPTLTDGRPSLLLSYAHEEITPRASPRVIFKTDHFIALVPYWATWPFETMVLPYKRHIAALVNLTSAEQEDLADVLRRLTIRLDNLFSTSFPYSMGIYQTPVARDTFNASVSQLFISFYPPLLRSATVKKFLVGFEMFAENQRDITPESAASRLKELSEVHYREEVLS